MMHTDTTPAKVEPLGWPIYWECLRCQVSGVFIPEAERIDAFDLIRRLEWCHFVARDKRQLGSGHQCDSDFKIGFRPPEEN